MQTKERYSVIALIISFLFLPVVAIAVISLWIWLIRLNILPDNILGFHPWEYEKIIFYPTCLVVSFGLFVPIGWQLAKRATLPPTLFGRLWPLMASACLYLLLAIASYELLNQYMLLNQGKVEAKYRFWYHISYLWKIVLLLFYPPLIFAFLIKSEIRARSTLTNWYAALMSAIFSFLRIVINFVQTQKYYSFTIFIISLFLPLVAFVVALPLGRLFFKVWSAFFDWFLEPGTYIELMGQMNLIFNCTLLLIWFCLFVVIGWKLAKRITPPLTLFKRLWPLTAPVWLHFLAIIACVTMIEKVFDEIPLDFWLGNLVLIYLPFWFAFLIKSEIRVESTRKTQGASLVLGLFFLFGIATAVTCKFYQNVQ
jgi:hypothetical protein